jgi:SAM-dependent methyltransferase
MAAIDQSISEFRARVEKDWATEETAAAWQKYFPQMHEQFAAVTQALVDAADPKPGMNILDLASGVGEPSLSFAERVAPGGTVKATDLSSAMLSALRHNAEAAGLTNLKTQTVDAHELPFPNNTFDRVTSRFGVMFFAEVDMALREMKRVLKPNGKVALMVWGPPDPGTYFAATALPYIKRLDEQPDPDGPGPMRFAEPGKLAKHFEATGFRNVQEQPHRLYAPFAGTPEELLSCLFEIAAPFRNAAAQLTEEQRKGAEEEVYSNLRPLYDGKLTNVAAPVTVVMGTK